MRCGLKSIHAGRTGMTSDTVFTVKDAAHYLKLSEMTILRLANQGLIPGAKIGRQWRFSKEAVIGLIYDPEILKRILLKRPA